MIEDKTRRTLDFGALRDAIERRDPDALTAFYSEDAELRIVHTALPEGPAFELRGRVQIKRYLSAICEQEMTCSVQEGAVIGEGSIEFCEVCEYPNGTPISVKTRLEVSEGLIVRQLDVVERADPDEGSGR